MKRSLLSSSPLSLLSLRSAMIHQMNRIWMGILILIGLTINTHFLVVVVDAQLFIDCVDGGTILGFPYEACVYNAASPLTFTLWDDSMVSFGTESYAVIKCLYNVPRSPFTCKCDILVNPSDPVAENDSCNWCVVAAVSDSTFIPYFDCSNRLVGDCVGFDSDGYCIDNSGSIISSPPSAPIGTSTPQPTVFPVTIPAPVSFPDAGNTPSPQIAFPVYIQPMSPTPVSMVPSGLVAIESPTTNNVPMTTSVPVPVGAVQSEDRDDIQASPNEGGSKSLVGIAIGCVVGGFVLALAIGLFVYSRNQKQSKSNIKPSIISTSMDPYRVASNTDDNFRSSQSIREAPLNNANGEEPMEASDHQDVYTVHRDESIQHKNRTSQSSSSSSPRLPPMPNNYGVVHAHDPSRNVGQIPQLVPTPPSEVYRDVPSEIALGVSTFTSTSSLSAPSRTTMTEPSGIVLFDV